MPTQRTSAGLQCPAEQASAAAAALALVQPSVAKAIEHIDQDAMDAPSLLPEWRRGHLVSHLARNADALVNLLAWARTGNEQHAYASNEDRDADINEGADRLAQVIREDFDAASRRFDAAVTAMPERAWEAGVSTRQGYAIGAHSIVWLRVLKLVVHLVDLDVGTSWSDLDTLPLSVLEPVLEVALLPYRNNDHTPVATIRAQHRGETRDHALAAGPNGPIVEGSITELLGWLTHRTDGSGLRGELPQLPSWLS